MRAGIVTRNIPDPEGTAPGRALFALVEGLRSEGCDVRVWSWGPDRPDRLPVWCEWRALPAEAAWRRRGRAAVRPRWDASRLALDLDDVDVAVADTPVSFAAVASHPRSVVTVHYGAWLDLLAVGPRTPARLQDVRAERAATARAALTVAYSDRVAAALRRPGRGPARSRPVVAPIAFVMPDETLVPSAEPVAACVGDWCWPPNARALQVLRASWTLLRERMPAASLLLAGPGLEPGHPAPGVTVLGPVRSSAEVLSRAAVVVFPCPPSSGPKVKVIEAMALGLPVVTTAAGLEGLRLGGPDPAGAVVAPGQANAFALATEAMLRAPERCAAVGLAGRDAIRAGHAPRPAARARIAAWRALL